MSDGPDSRLEPGLVKADETKVGSGWVAAEVNVGSETDLAITAEAGMKITDHIAGYADAWLKPLDGQYGGDIGARINNKVDLFAGGWGDTSGGWGAQAGVKFTF